MNFFKKYRRWFNFLFLINHFYSPIFGDNINLKKYTTNSMSHVDEKTYKEQALYDIQKISDAKLLKYETIASTNIFSKEEKTNFYLIVSFEINRRTNELDASYKYSEKLYANTIRDLESKLNLPIHHINEINISYETKKITTQLRKLKFDRFSTTYIESRKQAHIKSLIYRKKELLYNNYLKKIKNYISILEKLYFCSNSNQFSNLLTEYSKAKKILNL